jgi:hypothetical protein
MGDTAAKTAFGSAGEADVEFGLDAFGGAFLSMR